MLFISEATKADYDDPNNQIAVSWKGPDA
jgi:hypothetical protein